MYFYAGPGCSSTRSSSSVAPCRTDRQKMTAGPSDDDRTTHVYHTAYPFLRIASHCLFLPFVHRPTPLPHSWVGGRPHIHPPFSRLPPAPLLLSIPHPPHSIILFSPTTIGLVFLCSIPSLNLCLFAPHCKNNTYPSHIDCRQCPATGSPTVMGFHVRRRGHVMVARIHTRSESVKSRQCICIIGSVGPIAVVVEASRCVQY